MTQNEEKADLEVPVNDETLTFRLEYTKLLAHHYRLRKVVEADFKRMIVHLKDARESSRSDSLHTINQLLDYLERVVPELKKLRLTLVEQMGEIAEFIDTQEGTLEKMFEASPRFF
jgi:hypothetical protein